MTIRNSKFMADCSDNDLGKEAVLSFQISWILRNVVDRELQHEKPILYSKCRSILFTLLQMADDNQEILDVKVWKEWALDKHNRVDVIANVKLRNADQEESWHILLIENKVYTSLKENQISDYPRKVKEEYDSNPYFTGYTLHQCISTCQEGKTLQDVKNLCMNTAWKVYEYYDLVDWENDPLTESDLFNEFWYSTWDRIPG